MVTARSDAYTVALGADLVAGDVGGVPPPPPAPSFVLSGPLSATVGANSTYSITGSNLVPGTTYTGSLVSGDAGMDPTPDTFNLTSLAPTNAALGVLFAAAGTQTLKAIFGGALESNTLSVGVSPAPSPPPPPPPPPAPSGNFYRTDQQYLFQPVPVDQASTLGGAAYDFERWGPHRKWVDFQSGWPWDNEGGDWIDSALTRQGTSHWATGSVSALGANTLNVTAALQFIRTQDRWCALRLTMASSFVSIAGPLTPGGDPAPSISVTYTDATPATLACRIVGRLSGGSSAPSTTDEDPSGTGLQLPAALEFERPTKAVASATLNYWVRSKGGGTITVQCNVLDPTINPGIPTGKAGLASQAGLLDFGITSVPNVIGAHRYNDGTTASDYLHPTVINYNLEDRHSPEFWGGAVDTALLPYAGLGKWIAANQDEGLWSVVGSGYTGEGFVPLASGMGALRVVMPDTNPTTGQEQGNGGTTAAARKIYLPAAEYGLLDRIFVRYYVRLGTPYYPTRADRVEIRRFGTPEWTSMGGKWGITPEHVTTYGGFSGSSGGPFGWQLRHKWTEAALDTPGPNEGAITAGFHMFDFLTNNPAGHRYGSETDSLQNESWGKGGGRGATFYPGRWYCIETELDLNSVNAPSGAGDGLDWTPDGALRTWVDNVLVYERTGMVFRAKPIHAPAFSGSALRPARDLGIKALLFNWFHGGLNNSSIERTMFVTGLVWGKERIGPMRMPAPVTVAAGTIQNISLNNRNSINPANDYRRNPNFPGEPPWMFPAGFGWSEDQLSEFCGAIYCKDWGDAGRYVMWGAPGHSAQLEYPGWVVFDVATRSWMLLDDVPPVPYVTQAQWDSGTPPSTQADRTWGEWIGGSTDWPVAFRRPGYNPPFGCHTRNSFVYVPAAAAGNNSGEIVVAWHGTLGASGTGVACQHIYNCDTGLWRRTANARPGFGSSVGGVAYHPGENVVVGFSIESSGTASTLDYLDLSNDTWTRRNPTAGISVSIDSSNFVCGDLFVYVNNGATQTMRACRVSQVKAGGAWSWSTLTVSATSWPLKSGGSLPNTLSCQWSRCPVNGAWYAVDRNAGSLTLWKLTKPTGVADSDHAGLLAGTWNVTSETLTGPGLEPAQYDYCRLQWCDAQSAFLWVGDLHTSNVQAIRPAGV